MTAPLMRWWRSIAFRQAFIYGALVMFTMFVLLAVFYQETVGVWDRRVDRQIDATTRKLVNYGGQKGNAALAAHITELLGDGIDSDTEIYALAGPSGERLGGNLTLTPDTVVPSDDIVELRVLRAGRSSQSRLRATRLADGSTLVIGRDMRDLHELDRLVRRASVVGSLVALMMALGGALVFRRQLERRIGAIRQTAIRIERGDLAQRVPVPQLEQHEDEFARLSRDINAMLDRIHVLMDGVRHVSNTIAHNFRTPLSRILARLRTAQASRNPAQELPQATQFAIDELEDLTVIFEKLLQIAEIESGACRQAFAPVSLDAVAADVLDFYDALAEQKGVALTRALDGATTTVGDGDLLASALANLVDNAIKYTPPGGAVHVVAVRQADDVALCVRDNGCGIASEERARVGERFHRLDRSVPGWGLGLASVIAIARLHGGSLQLDDAGPGLIARLVLPIESKA